MNILSDFWCYPALAGAQTFENEAWVNLSKTKDVGIIEHYVILSNYCVIKAQKNKASPETL